jgi:Skp family chaperone for outer membrane proteins
MHRVHRFVALGILAGAASLGLALRSSGQAAAQPGAAGAPAAAPRIAVIDVFLIAERMMNAPDLVKARNDADAAWKPRLTAIEDAAKALDERLRVMQQGDPQAQQLLQERQAKVQEYQGLLQERQSQLEKSNSEQLLGIYAKIRGAADTLAASAGYTHVLVSASADRPILTTTVQDTLQQILARPVITYPAGDDITKRVMDALGVPPEEPKADQPKEFNPNAPGTPAGQPPAAPATPVAPGAAPKR